MCLRSCLSKVVKGKLTHDCKSEEAILQELDRQYVIKDRVINQIIDDVMEMLTPASTDPGKCATFYRAILSAVNDLSDFNSEECLKNPAITSSLVKKLPPTVRDKWWQAVYSLDGQIIPDEEEPEKFITFIKWQLNIADEMIAHGSRSTQTPKKDSTKVAQSSQSQASSSSSRMCKVCIDGSHPIRMCQQFRSMNPKQRNEKVLELKLCFKCLKDRHQAFRCCHKNPRLCQKCNRGAQLYASL